MSTITAAAAGNSASEEQAVPNPKWRERLDALRDHTPLLFRMVWEAAPGAVVANLVARTAASLIPLAILTVTGKIIQSIHSSTSHKAPLPGYFWWLVGLEFCLAAFSTVLVRVIDLCDTLLADKFTRHIGVRTVTHASTLDLSSYEDPIFYDKMERARAQGTDRLIMVRSAGLLFQQAITALSLSASILVFSPWILLILIVCVVPAFLGETHFAFVGYSLNFQQTTARRQMEYLAVLGGSRESAKELKLFRLGPFIVQCYQELSDRLHKQNLVLAKRKVVFAGLLTIVGTVGYYGAYAFVIYRTVDGALTLGTMTILAGAIAGASSNIQAFFSTFAIIADQALFMSDLFEFFAVQPKIRSKPNALPPPRPVQRGFEFKNVSFQYPGRPKPVLDNVSFTLEPSARIALVGENGQGKTTIVKLITRLYDPTGGQILLDGTDIREYDLEELRKEIGVIFQDFTRYELTAAENIAVGQIEERANESLIHAAANKSLAEKMIRKLPHGYDQTLGSHFEGAINLSGGEWQKLALARAYLREAQLLVLDEPAAALDARSEHEVFERFAELTKGKMALLISHRFSTVRVVDRILLLENGRIAEEGSHDELMRLGGRYGQMFKLQSAHYV